MGIQKLWSDERSSETSSPQVHESIFIGFIPHFLLQKRLFGEETKSIMLTVRKEALLDTTEALLDSFGSSPCTLQSLPSC